MTLTDLSLRKRIQQAKPDNLWLLAGLTFGLIPHFIRLPLLIMLPSLILLGWRLVLHHASPAPPDSVNDIPKVLH